LIMATGRQGGGHPSFVLEEGSVVFWEMVKAWADPYSCTSSKSIHYFIQLFVQSYQEEFKTCYNECVGFH
jgi:hypothetical protein